jgi:hypothetical protein
VKRREAEEPEVERPRLTDRGLRDAFKARLERRDES